MLKTLIKHIYLDETIERLPTALYLYNFKLRRIIKKHAAQKFHTIGDPPAVVLDSKKSQPAKQKTNNTTCAKKRTQNYSPA